jgi:hypothetical protein
MKFQNYSKNRLSNVILITVLFTGLLSLLKNSDFLIPKLTSVVGSSYFEIPSTLSTLNLMNFGYQPVFLIIYFSLISLIGMGMILHILENPRIRNDKIFPYLLPLCGVLPGYLASIAITRVITLFFSQQISLILWFACGCISVSVALKTVIREGIYSHSRVKVISIFTTLLFFEFFLINQVQVNLYAGLNLHVFGDATTGSINWLQNFNSDPSKMVPIFSEHYDETLFFTPFNSVFASFNSSPDYMLWFWFLYSLGKASTFALLLLLARSVINSTLTSLGLTVLMFFGSLALNPLASPLLFDAGNNFASTGHIGRAFTNIICLIFMVGIFSGTSMLKPAKKYTTMAFYIVLGLGMSSLTFSLMFCLMFLIVVNTLWKLEIHPVNKYFQLALILFLLLFVLPISNLFSGTVIGAYLLGALIWVCISLALSKQTPFKNFRRVHPIAIGILFGNVFCGNLISSKIMANAGLLADRLSTRGIEGKMKLEGFGLAINPGQYPFGHLGNPLNMAIFFGLPLMLIAAYLLFGNDSNPKNSKELMGLYWILLGLLSAFFILDYLNAGYTEVVFIWLKTRLVEPFFLLLIFKTIWIWDNSYSQFSKLKDTKIRIENRVIFAYLSIGLIGTIPGGQLSQMFTNIQYCLGFFK